MLTNILGVNVYQLQTSLTPVNLLHFVRNGEKCKMHKIYWCEEGLQLSDIATKNFGDHYLTPIMKYIIVRLDN